MKGFIVSIFTDKRLGSCTNGISAKVEMLTLIGEDLPQIHEPTPEAPGMHVVYRHVNGLTRYPTVFPLRKGKMLFSQAEYYPFSFGGNFAYASDSRFRQKLCAFPIPIHDRYEPFEKYAEGVHYGYED